MSAGIIVFFFTGSWDNSSSGDCPPPPNRRLSHPRVVVLEENTGHLKLFNRHLNLRAQKKEKKQEEAEKEKKMGPWPPAGQGRPRIPSQVRKHSSFG